MQDAVKREPGLDPSGLERRNRSFLAAVKKRRKSLSVEGVAARHLICASVGSSYLLAFSPSRLLAFFLLLLPLSRTCLSIALCARLGS